MNMNQIQRINLLHKATLIIYLCFVLLLVAAWWLNANNQTSLSLLFITIIPILVFLPWLLKGNNSAHIGLGCILLIYITKAVMDAIALTNLLTITTATTSLILFFAALYYVHAKHLLRKQ